MATGFVVYKDDTKEITAIRQHKATATAEARKAGISTHATAVTIPDGFEPFKAYWVNTAITFENPNQSEYDETLSDLQTLKRELKAAQSVWFDEWYPGLVRLGRFRLHSHTNGVVNILLGGWRSVYMQMMVDAATLSHEDKSNYLAAAVMGPVHETGDLNSLFSNLHAASTTSKASGWSFGDPVRWVVQSTKNDVHSFALRTAASSMASAVTDHPSQPDWTSQDVEDKIVTGSWIDALT